MNDEHDLTDDQCDRLVELMMDELAQRYSTRNGAMHALDLNPSVTEHHTLPICLESWHPMEVEINGVVYEPGAATYMCKGCAARHDIGLCADLTEKFPCTDFIWQTKEIKEPVTANIT